MSPSSSPRPFVYVQDRLVCSGVDVTALAEQYGTPLYVYSADAIRERATMLQQAFAAAAPRLNTTLCYAVKANSSLAILKMLGEAGCGFDIVSGGELERVKRAAPQSVGKVVFSGVGKQAWEMDAALQAGILLFNVESEAELELLSERAVALNKTARIALRVNPDVFAETHPYISTGLSAHKFGIAIARARAVYQRAASLPGLKPEGVSVHIGSQIRAVEPFGQALARVRSLVEELRSDGIAIHYVDAGGGFGIEYGEGAFDPAASVASYAKELAAVMQGLDAQLLLEPGRFLVAQAGALVTRVLYTKQNGDKHFVITDAAMNDLIRPALYQAHHEIWPVVKSDRAPQKADIVGPVCESGDFFARDRLLPELEAGDLAALLDAGAYGMTLASHYNTRVHPAEVLVEGGAARLVRRRETLDELMAAEIL
ncbi:diaminopimelate decarboxylase [Granulicella sp. 5B5]|uniref:diaminopimelate decarboxylase n=1 Tax=Granulicella sp. 5B5 TaxID=1617967 RepID=UPI0015F5D935|nr:diaminopimelate decarboxylase [Granulicella sp. 5B5]QMV19819.1 diaminopimelate decarboxylase [Granulicella sp. 5B5]